jgi:predicted MFS family arabinose efflux permease
MVLFIPSIASLLILSYIDRGSLTAGLSLSLACIGLAKSVAYYSNILMITESGDQTRLGTTHGLASTVASLARSIGPVLAGSLFEVGSSGIVVGCCAAVALSGACISLFKIDRGGDEYGELEKDEL